MPVDSGAIDDLLEDGRRMLRVQLQERELVERRFAELLRLAVATLGGVVLVSGLLVTTRFDIDVIALLGLATGVLCVSLAAFTLARMIVGRAEDMEFAYGLNLGEALLAIREGDMTRAEFRESAADAMPHWLARNDQTLARQRAGKRTSLGWLATGVSSVLAAILYMVGGHILA